MFRENQTRGCVLKAEETVVGHKETLDCLKTQTAQGKLRTELKNEVSDKARLCTSRCGGILKACYCGSKANVVEQEAVFRVRSRVPRDQSSCCGEILLFLPFLNCNKTVPKSGEERNQTGGEGQNSGKVHFIKVGRDFLLRSEVIL